MLFFFLFSRYYSDTDFTGGRSQNETLSPSPIPNAQTSTLELDTINNNNRNNEMNFARKTGLSTCLHQNKSESMLRPVPAFRPNCNSNQLDTSTIDTRLNDWLNACHIDTISKNIILAEQFTYDDFIYGMEKTDLYRIGLK